MGEARERLRELAFLAWQLGAGGRIRFGDYLAKLGLDDAPAQVDAVSAEEAIARAEAIKARDRRRQQRKQKQE